MKLEWEKNPSRERMSWYDANDYTKDLGRGWRLPTIEELKQAYNDKIEFKFSHYWSSSSSVGYINCGWIISFVTGNTLCPYKTANYHVRCVREIQRIKIKEKSV